MKLNLKPEAIKLRKEGYSVADIARRLHISESTASLWCQGLVLSPKQIATLNNRTHRKLEKFFKIVREQQLKRQKKNAKIVSNASQKTSSLTKSELFIAGVALYWAEGFKHAAEGRIGFCNSDLEMMKFMIKFLKTCLAVKTEEISPRLTVNITFKDNVSRIEKFWSDELKLPLPQFTKPFFQRTTPRKHYENPEDYHGVLRIHVRKSSRLLTKMRGYLEGFKIFAQQDR